MQYDMLPVNVGSRLSCIPCAVQVLVRVKGWPESRMHQMAADANRFAYAYLGYDSRVVYWAEALTRWAAGGGIDKVGAA